MPTAQVLSLIITALITTALTTAEQEAEKVLSYETQFSVRSPSILSNSRTMLVSSIYFNIKKTLVLFEQGKEYIFSYTDFQANQSEKVVRMHLRMGLLQDESKIINLLTGA